MFPDFFLNCNFEWQSLYEALDCINVWSALQMNNIIINNKTSQQKVWNTGFYFDRSSRKHHYHPLRPLGWRLSPAYTGVSSSSPELIAASQLTAHGTVPPASLCVPTGRDAPLTWRTRNGCRVVLGGWIFLRYRATDSESGVFDRGAACSCESSTSRKTLTYRRFSEFWHFPTVSPPRRRDWSTCSPFQISGGL